eukprot:m51a1_g5295 putative pre-mrna-splicing factor atp-dependent rna helicase prp16 (1262) ;mRNA; r:218527-223351
MADTKLGDVARMAAKALGTPESTTLARTIISEARAAAADFPAFQRKMAQFGFKDEKALIDLHAAALGGGQGDMPLPFVASGRLEPDTESRGGLYRRKDAEFTFRMPELPHQRGGEGKLGLKRLAEELAASRQQERDDASPEPDRHRPRHASDASGDTSPPPPRSGDRGDRGDREHSRSHSSHDRDRDRERDYHRSGSSSSSSTSSAAAAAGSAGSGERRYRDRRAETPSHSGGVDEDLVRRRREAERERRLAHTQRSASAGGAWASGGSGSGSGSGSRPPGWEAPSRSGGVLIRMPRRGNPGSITPATTPPPPSADAWPQAEGAAAAAAAAVKQEEGEEGAEGARVKREEEEAEAERRFDRDFYEMDEDGAVDVEKFESETSGWERAAPEGSAADAELTRRQVQRLSARRARANEDNAKWEEAQMKLSGVVRETRVATEFADESELRVHLLVHAAQPPFLDGRVVFTRLQDPVLPVRDPTSDLAQIARAGSLLVRERRERREREKGARARTDVANSRMGQLLGIKAEAQDAQGGAEAEEASNSFGGFAAKKTEAVSEFARSNTVWEQRRLLPIFQARRDLLQVVCDNQVVVIVGETGSGKTTQLTQYLHEAGLTANGVIGCTQPRRVAAMSVAKRVSDEMGVSLGGLVGYAIRFEDCTSESTRIKYMTDGVLLRESLKDPLLLNYAAVIMDEAHERSLHTDVLFGILKKVVAGRTDMKLIVTSATMDADKFSRFFGAVPVFKIPGRTFPVDVMFSKAPCQDYVDAAVKQVLTIHVTRGVGDILVFMTGQEDIECACEVLEERAAQIEGAAPLLVLPIFSQMPSELQAKIFDRAPPGTRKCIVSTNIAETSLTVDGILYVIDSGYCKMKVYNPKVGMDALQVFPISRQNAVQRTGRAGRTGPGQCYRLYTEGAFKHEMLDANVPEIQRTNLSNTVLLLKSLGVEDLLEFEFMDPPPQENLVKSMFHLWALGALDSSGRLTQLGRRMVEFPLDPPLSKMLIYADECHCAQEILTVVSMLSVPPVFHRPRERQEESDAAREKFFVPESDHLTLLNVFQMWKQNQFRADWCAEHFINAKAMRRVREIRTQLVDIMRQARMAVDSCGTNWDCVRKVIASAYFVNAARLKGLGEYVNMHTAVPCCLHPTSALYGLGITPDYLVYHELVLTQREYMQCVTAVEPQWLAELAPMFFSVREGFQQRMERRQREREMGERMEHEMEQAVADDQAKREQEELLKFRSAQSMSKIATPGRGPTPRRTPYRVGI